MDDFIAGEFFFFRQGFNFFVLKSMYLFIWLCWVFFVAQGLSLVAVSRGLLFLAVHRLLTVVASLVGEQKL